MYTGVEPEFGLPTEKSKIIRIKDGAGFHACAGRLPAIAFFCVCVFFFFCCYPDRLRTLMFYTGSVFFRPTTVFLFDYTTSPVCPLFVGLVRWPINDIKYKFQNYYTTVNAVAIVIFQMVKSRTSVLDVYPM